MRLLLSSALILCSLAGPLRAQFPITTSRGPAPKGQRLLGVSITESETEGFASAIARAQAAGMQTTSLALAWDDLESAPGVFGSNPDWLAIADAYYPSIGVAISLEINPIDTVTWRVPAYLSGLPIDDPLVVSAYKNLLTWAFAQIPNLDVIDFVIGNEIDGVLGADPVQWARYTNFLAQVAPHARQQRQGLSVGSKVMFDGLLGPAAPLAASLNRYTDAVLTTYYPLWPDFTVKPPSTVQVDFAALVGAYPGRRIRFKELGYPSGALCLSSEALQAEFIRQTFAAWDIYRAEIEQIEFVWLTDISPEVLDQYRLYYGNNDPVFLEYLATLGLRTYPALGTDKQGYVTLAEQAHLRGW
jgi:hypothetical protein